MNATDSLRDTTFPLRNGAGFIPALGLWWHKKRWLSRAGSRYADKIVTVSDKVRERLVTDIGYRADKLVVVRNGVPWKEFVRDETRGRAVRREHGIPDDAFVFGMLSRLSHDKRIDTALHALKRLIDECPDRSFYLVVAGHGKDAEKRASEHAREIEDLSWGKWAGRVDEYLQHIDALLSPGLIIIGGGISRKSDKFLPLLKSLTAPVVPASMHNDAGIVGAAMSADQPETGSPGSGPAAGSPAPGK